MVGAYSLPRRRRRRRMHRAVAVAIFVGPAIMSLGLTGCLEKGGRECDSICRSAAFCETWLARDERGALGVKIGDWKRVAVGLFVLSSFWTNKAC